MYTIPRFSVANPVLVSLLTFLVIGAGTASLFLLPRELFPRVASDFVLVITLYPRASADDIEKTVTVPIEEEISDVAGIKEMRSTTAEGRSVILLEVDTDVEPIDRVQRNVENEVDQVIPKLPADCEKPITKEFIFEFPVVTVSVAGAVDAHELQSIAEKVQDRLRKISGVSDVTLAGERDEEVWVEVDPLRLYGYELTLSEVREAIATGGSDLAAGIARAEGNEFIIRTKELYTGPEDVGRVVLRADGDGSRIRVADIAGTRDTFEEATQIDRIDGERCINLDVKQRSGGDSIDTAEEVMKVLEEIKGTLPAGVSVRPNRDVSFMVRERLQLLTSNGLQGLVLCLLLLRLFLNTRAALFTGLGIPFALMGAFILMGFWGVSLNMVSMFGLIVVLGILDDDSVVVVENIHRYRRMGLDPKTAAIKGSGELFWSILGSVCTAMASFMPLFFMTGIMGKFIRPLPQVVIFALIASLFEVLFCLPAHLAEKGDERDWRKVLNFPISRLLAHSSEKPTRSTFGAILAFLFRIPLVALEIALFPFAKAGVLLMRAGQKIGAVVDSSPISPHYWFPSFMRFYLRLVIHCLRNRLAFLVLTVGILGIVLVSMGIGSSSLDPVPRIQQPLMVGFGCAVFLLVMAVSFQYGFLRIVVPGLLIVGLFTGYTARHLKFQLFKNNDFDFFFINLELHAGARLEATEATLAKIEASLLDDPDRLIEAVITRVGMIEDNQTGQISHASNKGQIIVDLMESSKRLNVTGQDVLDRARENLPPLPEVTTLEFKSDNGGPPVGSAVTLRVMGEDYGTLLAVSDEVQQYLAGVPGVSDIKDDFEWGKEEFRIDVDEQKAADLGIDIADVAAEVRNAFGGGLATSFTRGKKEVEIYAKFTEAYRVSPENIRLMKFRSRNGSLVPFDSFARVVYGQSASAFFRWNQNRAVTVTASVDGERITSAEINERLKELYPPRSETPEGVQFEYGGEERDTQESMASLGRAFAFAMCVNYGIIATVFNSLLQPFIVMSVIPLSLIGVLIGHLAHGEPIGFMGMMGSVALVGIVVNNSIVMVDFMNHARRAGMNRWRSIVWGARTRVRPIILTSGTTIVGLLPSLWGLRGTSSFLTPTAISMVYGMMFSTLLTLVVVPVLMASLDDLKNFFGLRLTREDYDETLLQEGMRLGQVEET